MSCANNVRVQFIINKDIIIISHAKHISRVGIFEETSKNLLDCKNNPTKNSDTVFYAFLSVGAFDLLYNIIFDSACTKNFKRGI